MKMLETQGSCSLFHMQDYSVVKTQILHCVRVKAVSGPKVQLN